jgi:hypothetical protein
MADIKLKVTRDQLAKVFKDHDTLKQFERLITYMNTLVPAGETDIGVAVGAIETKTNYLVSEIHELKKQYGNVITVAKIGGDFLTIKEAINFITDNSTNNRYTIDIAPGVYIEDNPIQCKEFVNIEAIGIHSIVVQPLNTSTDLFIGARFAHIVGIVFDNVTGSNNYAVNHSSPGELLVEDCVFRNCSNGVLLNHISAGLELYNCAANTPTTNTDKLITVTAGVLSIDNLKIRISATIETIMHITGVNSLCSISEVQSLSPNVTTGLFANDGCRISGHVLRFVNMVDGIVVQGNNTQVRIDGNQIFNLKNDGFRINNVGTGIILALFSTTISACLGFNFNILNPNSTTIGNGFTEIDNSFIIPGSKMYAYLLDTKEDDAGFNVIGEFHVGLPERPVESAIGGGDSYTRGMFVYTKTELGVFVDVSIDARSASASTFTFPGIIADNSIYISSSLVGELDVLEHFGIKTKVLTAAVQGTGNIIIEYWNGVAWVAVSGMEVDSLGNYWPHANNYFQDIGSHHIRYNSQLAIDSWTKNDPMLLGTDYYWIRFRIVTDITTAPIFEQFKLHTNRTEINADGWNEYFGKARPIGQLALNFSAARPFEGNMQSQELYINEDVGVGYTQNKFTATGDKSGVSGFLPFDFDSSSPIIMEWSGRPTQTQTIVWTIRAAWVTDNGIDEYYTSEPALLPGRIVETVTQDIIAGEVSMFNVHLNLEEIISRRENAYGDELWISLQPSTLSGTFAITSSQATYTKWSEGGHI